MTPMIRLLCMLAAAFPLIAHASVRVESVDGRVLLRATADKIAAWKNGADSLVLLADGKGDVQLAAVPRSLQAEAIERPGVHGVVLRGVGGAWTAFQQDGEWLLREGAPQQERASALLLKDGWRVNGKPVSHRGIEVDGVRWQVAMLGLPLSVQGSVVGLVRKDAAVAAAAEDKPEEGQKEAAAPEDVPESTMKVVSMDQMLARIRPAGAKPAKAEPLAAPSGLLQAEGKEGGEKVPFHRAAPLAGLGMPSMLSETLSLLPALEVYVPGKVVSLTVPLEFLRMAPASDTLPPLVEEGLSSRQAEVAETRRVAPVRLLFPPREGNFEEALSLAMRIVAEAEPDSTAERKARLDLAAFYLAWQRPEEAAVVLHLLPARVDGLPEDPVARLYAGLADLAMGRVPAEAAFDQQGVLAADAQLWRAVLASRNEDYGRALQDWPRERGILPRYPDYLREKALVAQATALVRVGDKKTATKAVDDMVAGYPAGLAPAALVRLQGLVRLGTPDEAAGMEFLAQAAADTRDLAQAYRAKFEFVQALRQRQDLADAQVIQYLEDLWLDWRGDDLERDVLGALADLYDRTGHPREALERWQALVRAYPGLPDINVVTDRMTNAFLHVFDPENPHVYDLLSYLGLYYDFRELVPNDERGDRLQEQVAKMLADATLWDRAAPVLEQLLNYRPLDAAAQSRLTLLLAEVYRRQGHPADAIKLLDKWQRMTVKTEADLRTWHLAQARSLLDLNRPDSAKRELASLKDDPEALKLRVEADWKQKDWKGAVTSLQAQLKGVNANQAIEDSGAQLAIFQLAYAYGQLKDGGGVNDLRERYAQTLQQVPALADEVNAVSAVTGVADVEGGGALAPLTVAMADINKLTDRIEVLRVEDRKALQEQEDYNKKMEYMDLLPPPSL